jgi:signal transduction histidine kinase
MTFKQYISDQKWLLITFYFIMAFISILLFVEPSLQISLCSLIYLLVTSIIIFNLYFIGFYFYKNNHLKKWLINSEPVAAFYEENVYLHFLKNLEDKYLSLIQERNQDSKEQLEFMTQWVHEIKTPIAVSRLLLESELQSPSLEEEINKIERYVEQALHFTRLNEFNKDYLIQEIDIESLIKEVLKTESSTFIAKRVKLILNLKPMTVFSDKKALVYVVRQLLSNSLKYTDENGEISISIKPELNQLVIHDNGIGIPCEDLPRIFEKGFTGKNGRTHTHSTGMGLYLAKKTVQKLGHEISLFSEENIYTEAILSFPTAANQYYQL